uniref:Uncharacterized protein n=1 Tax=Ursus maritimus TaxID=29073 RepID=A0A452VCE1_URSMA
LQTTGGHECRTPVPPHVLQETHPLHSKSLSNEENLKLFGTCNTPNGRGHNYTHQRPVTATIHN